MSDGFYLFTGSSGNTSIDVTSWDWNNLTITPPANSDADFTLSVTATESEVANGDQAIRTDTIDIEVTAVADQPTLTVPATVTVAEDTNSATFAISSSVTDTDGSESISLRISDVPAGARDSPMAQTRSSPALAIQKLT